MTQTLREIMTPNPITVAIEATAIEAAQSMRDHDVGNVVVTEQGSVCAGSSPTGTSRSRCRRQPRPRAHAFGEICSRELTTVSADADDEEAVQIMREKARREGTMGVRERTQDASGSTPAVAGSDDC
jgi:CBS domain-containing protein